MEHWKAILTVAYGLGQYCFSVLHNTSYRTQWSAIIVYYQATILIQTFYLIFICNMTSYWSHWRQLVKSLINILSLICFARNGLFIASHISSLWCEIALEKFFLAKQINYSIYIYIYIWRIPSLNKLFLF